MHSGRFQLLASGFCFCSRSNDSLEDKLKLRRAEISRAQVEPETVTLFDQAYLKPTVVCIFEGVLLLQNWCTMVQAKEKPS